MGVLFCVCASVLLDLGLSSISSRFGLAVVVSSSECARNGLLAIARAEVLRWYRALVVVLSRAKELDDNVCIPLG